jgi:uncharacterized membrane-anchored protein
MNPKKLALTVALGLAAAFTSALSQSPAPDAADLAKKREALYKSLGGQQTGVGQIGSRAEMDIPSGYTFFPAHGAKEMLKRWGNLIDGDEDGLYINNQEGWSVYFAFSEIGYVKDDDKDSLNAEKLLKDMHDSEPASNAALKEAGLPTQHIVGFAMPPKYNDQTNNLEWAIKFTVEGKPGEFVNYRTKLLGRKGVMTATLMCDPDELQSVLPEYQRTLTGFRFKGGETYAEYKQGDKLATYGLAGLVAGGAALAAGKAGLFGKLGALIAKGGKLVIVAVVAVFAAIAKIFKSLFGRKDSTYQS